MAKNPSRANVLGRRANTLTGGAVQVDITNGSASDNSLTTPLIIVKDGRRYSVSVLVLGNNMTITPLGPNTFTLNATAIITPPSGSSSVYTYIALQAQNKDADEHTENAVTIGYFDNATDIAMTIMQSNMTGGTYTAEYWDGAAWQPLGVSMTTGGTPSPGPYTTGFAPIAAGATGAGGVPVRINQSGGGGDTDVVHAMLIARGTV